MRVNDASKAQSNSIDLLHSSSHKKREEEAQRVSAEHWTIWNEPEPEQEQFNWDNRLINIIDAQFCVTNWFTEMGVRKNVLLCDCAEEETSKLECYAISTMPISTSVIFSHFSFRINFLAALKYSPTSNYRLQTCLYEGIVVISINIYIDSQRSVALMCCLYAWFDHLFDADRTTHSDVISSDVCVCGERAWMKKWIQPVWLMPQLSPHWWFDCECE